MKNMTGFVMIAMMAGTSVHGASADPAEDRRVTVCMNAGGGLPAISLAQMTATQMFRGIGVKIDWHAGTCPSEGIVINLSQRTPTTLRPGALAYAKPYEGKHIVLFYDRIVDMYGRARVAPVLSHVLVHEITHILEGTARHSQRGVMKAHWASPDLVQMSRKPLGFEREDIELIHAGMEARIRRAMSAGGAVPAAPKPFAME